LFFFLTSVNNSSSSLRTPSHILYYIASFNIMAPSLSIRSMLRTPTKNTRRLTMAMMLDKTATAAESEAQQQHQFQQSEETSVSSSDEDRQQQQQQQHQNGGSSGIKRDANNTSSPFKSPCSVRLAASSMGGGRGSGGSSAGKQHSSHHHHHHHPSPVTSSRASPVKRIPRRNKSSVIVGCERDFLENKNQQDTGTGNAAAAAAARRRYSMPSAPSANENEENMSDSFAEIKFNQACDNLDCSMTSDHLPPRERKQPPLQQRQQRVEQPTPQKQKQPQQQKQQQRVKQSTPQKQNQHLQQQQQQQQHPLMIPRRNIAASMLRRANSSKNWLVPRSPRSKLSAFFSNANNTADSDSDNYDENENEEDVNVEHDKEKKLPPSAQGAASSRAAACAPPAPAPTPALPAAASCYESPVNTPVNSPVNSPVNRLQQTSLSRNSTSRSGCNNVRMPVVPASAPTLRKPSAGGGVLNRGGQLHLRTPAARSGPAQDYSCRRTASTMELMLQYDEILQEFNDSTRAGRTNNVSMSPMSGTTTMEKNKTLLNKDSFLPGPPPLLVNDDEKSITMRDGDGDGDDEDDDASIGLPEAVTATTTAEGKKSLALNRGGQVSSPQHAYFGRRAASTKDILNTYKDILDEFDDSLNDSSLNASCSSAMTLSLEDNPSLEMKVDNVDDHITMALQPRPRRRISCNNTDIRNSNVKTESAVTSSPNARLRQSRQLRKSLGVCDADPGRAASHALKQSPTRQQLRNSEHTSSSVEKSPRLDQRLRRSSARFGCANTKESISRYKSILREFDDSVCAHSRSDDSTLWTLGTKKSASQSTISYTHSAPTVRKPQTALANLLKQQQQQQQKESNINNSYHSGKESQRNGAKKTPFFAPPLEL
jgi:hypothetical protein